MTPWTRYLALRDLELTEAKCGALAHMEDLGRAQPGCARSQVALELELPDEAAEAHLGPLAVAVTLPVSPPQVGAHHPHLGCGVEQRAKRPVDRRARDVEVCQLQRAAQHREGERPE